MQCECFNWARQFNKEKLITKHHPGCQFSDGINYCDTEMSYEFLCNYIPFPVGLLLLIEK